MSTKKASVELSTKSWGPGVGSGGAPWPPTFLTHSLLGSPCLAHLVQPLPLEGHCHSQQDGDDTREIDIADDLGAQGKGPRWGLSQARVHGLRGSSPDHREEDGTAADEIHKEQDLLPQSVVTGTLLTGLNDNHILHKSPARADQGNGDEEKGALQPGGARAGEA